MPRLDRRLLALEADAAPPVLPALVLGLAGPAPSPEQAAEIAQAEREGRRVLAFVRAGLSVEIAEYLHA